jgi:probable H4MPT-linked C1 transfer pathway protein
MVSIAGWDIGGAHTKACRLEGVTLCRPLAVWREPERLPALLREMVDLLGPVDAHAVTMTAELCDCFATKADGVRYILRAVQQTFGQTPVWVWTTSGCFRPVAEVQRNPLPGAAANWLATATLLARRTDTGLLIDIGTTTTDLIPVADGRVAAAGRDDPSRLAHGELVYTGVVRTPICAVTPALYVRGHEVRLAAELFAVTGDAYLLLGLLDAGDYTGPTPDGRHATHVASAQRLARMLCADAEELGESTLRWLARQVMEAQVAAISRAAIQVLSRLERPETVPVMGAGLGKALAGAVAGRLRLPYSDIAELGMAGGQSAPAGAVARLLAEEVFA